MSNTELTLYPRPSLPSTQSAFDASSPRELLDRLKTRIQDAGEEYRQVLHDIYDMIDGALEQAEYELRDHSVAQKDGLLIQTFIPYMANILHRTVEYVESVVATPKLRNPERRTSLLRIRSKKLKKKSAIAKALMELRNNLEGIYYIAMPPAPSSTSSDRTDDALVIAASIGGALSVLCDSISILGPLKLVGVGLSEVCSTVQTLRSNNQLAAEIMRGVRDYFRMVVRKVQKFPAAQADEELCKDVTELLNNLVCVQETLLKLKRENRHIGSRVFFAQRDKESLNALKIRVQESRSTFEASLHLSTNLRVNEVAISMFEVSTGISQLLHFVREQPAPSSETSTSTLELPPPSPSPILEARGTAESQLMLPPVQPDSTTKQWVQVDLNRASYTKYHHSAMSLLPYAGVYFFFFELM